MRDRFFDIPVAVKEHHFEQLVDYTTQLKKNPKLENLFIEMTINCNENCRHCGSNCGDVKPENGLSDQEIIDMLTKLRDQIWAQHKTLPFLSITGGEPLLRPGFINLMMKIKELGYVWGMTSNGTLIDQDMAVQLKNAGLKSVSISIDGLKETHDWFRRTEGGFDKALASVKYLMEAGINSVMVTTVAHKHNMDEFQEIYELMKQINCKLWRLVNVEPIGRARNNPEIEMNKDDYKKMIDFIVEKQDDPDMKVIYSCNHYLGLDYERKTRDWYFACKAGITVASIQYNGDITACLDIERRPELVFGNIRKDDFLKVWKDRFEIYRQDKSEKSSKCKDCSERKRCQGGGYHTWDFDNNEPFICMYEMLH